jgi:hypothetical protein
MNESDLARKITRRLDSGLDLLKGETLARLQTARRKALAAYKPKPQTRFGWAWAGARDADCNGGFLPLQRAWVPLAALIFSLLLVTYWQGHLQMGDQTEIDAFLLAEDLPFTAYLDSGFDAWLADSARQ